MKKGLVILCILLFCFKSYCQITAYNYSCGNDKSVIIWVENHKDKYISLNTTQGSEVHGYLMDKEYKTLSWEYSDTAENTNIKVILDNGVYKMDGVFRSKSISKSFKSKGFPWYQNIGFNIGHSIRNKEQLKFECIRPDNLEFYVMQADAEEIRDNNGIREQRINVHLTGMLAKYFGSNYYINCNTRQFVRYNGVHGPPGTPETVITIK